MLSNKRKFNTILQSLVYGLPRIVLCYLCAESKAIMAFTRLEYVGFSVMKLKHGSFGAWRRSTTVGFSQTIKMSLH
jgi:hypothetical protein